MAARPPQYVVVSFDGSKSINMWKETRRISKDVGGSFTYFLSGVYFISSADKMLYRPPTLKQGRSDIGFGRNSADIAERVSQVDQAIREGAEMGSHVNGHFDGSKWTYGDWSSEFEQFHSFINKVFFNNPRINLPSLASRWEVGLSGQLRGFRAPLLAINNQSDRVLSDFGYLYDASRVAEPTKWPYQIGTVWQFPLAVIPIAGTAKKTISMDYNFYYQDSKAKDDLANASFYEDRYYQSLLNHFNKNYYGNRAPINVGNHFANWNGGAYFKGLLRFATEVCGNKAKYPEVECLNYKAMVEKLNEAGASQIIAWEKGKFPVLQQNSASPIGPMIANLVGPKEWELNLDFDLQNGQLVTQVSGRDRGILLQNPEAEWVISLWPSKYGLDEATKLALPRNEKDIVLVRSRAVPPQVPSQLTVKGFQVLRIGFEIRGREIQSVTKKVYFKNGKIVAISKVSEESIAAKGDLLEAHQE